MDFALKFLVYFMSKVFGMVIYAKLVTEGHLMNYQTLLLVLAITFFSANAIAGNERAEYCQKIAFGSHSREEIRDDPRAIAPIWHRH